MVSAAHLLLAGLTVVLMISCETSPSAQSISKNDSVAFHELDGKLRPWFEPRKHYEHVVRDSRGHIKDVYRYYLDEHGKAVLDGDRLIYRFEHDPGLIIEYRDGREVRRSEVIVTG